MSGSAVSLAPAAGVIGVPVTGASSVVMRYARVHERDPFDPAGWRSVALQAAPGGVRYEVDVNRMNLPDGAYEYEFVLDGARTAADPYAEELVRFGGYRGVFHIAGGRMARPQFSWAGELAPGQKLPNNNQIVIYELPLRWTGDSPDHARQIGLGDFDRLLFARLNHLAELGINTIELLPIQDSPDTLNWGYGSRFFFAPDFDLGRPVEVKSFIKRCHQLGIRVFLDVVMNHARECPLEELARERYFLHDGGEEGGRPDWGGRIFRYRQPAADGSFPAREFHCRMAEYWVREYHVDGFRIDEFKGIDNWDFIQEFRDRAWAEHLRHFPDRPFLVTAEDSWRRAAAARNRPGNPNGRKVVDSIWNFAFRDEARRLLRNRIHTEWGHPSRRERIQALISGARTWDGWDHSFKDGFSDLSQCVNYITSHDVEEEGEQRFMNYILGDLLRLRWLGSGSVENVRAVVDHMPSPDERLNQAHQEALDRMASAFALLLTSVGIPMFLAGEEFADVHDLDHSDWRLKMSDPVDWRRAAQPGHQALRERVRDLILLRTSSPALQRNEVEFFYFHPSIDENDGVRVFAYCRTNGAALGSKGQVAVVANCGSHGFPSFDLPWPWIEGVTEGGTPPSGARLHVRPDRRQATLSLAPFEVRVFAT